MLANIKIGSNQKSKVEFNEENIDFKLGTILYTYYHTILYERRDS